MKRIITVAVALLALLAGGAGATTYTCKVTPDNNRHWIPRTLLINIDDQSGDVLVYDDVIKAFPGKPVAGKLSAETGRRVTVKWTVRQLRDDYGQNTARFFFRASYYKNSGKLVMSSIPGGWDNMFGGQGHCRLTPDADWNRVLADTAVAGFSPRGKARFFMSGEGIWVHP